MRHRPGHLALWAGALLSVAMAAPVLAGDREDFDDPEHDASLRVTASNGTLTIAENLPDVQTIRIGAWDTQSGPTNPYCGTYVSHVAAHLVRIDIILRGVINPPGPLGFSGPAYDPFMYGNSPLYGFFDFDVDNDRDTGGDLDPGEAALHYLGNVARFGTMPQGPLAARAATGAGDLFESWNHPPQIQLSGADWTLAFCGCFPAVPVYKDDPNATTFCAGSTWIMEGRFFKRTSAYRAASVMTGGSQPGAYDPIVRVRFRHDTNDNQTTVTLVYPLDDAGSVLLTGTPSQQYNTNVGDHNSIAEGVSDLIEAAQTSHVPPLDPTSLAFQVTQRWRTKGIANALNVEEWRPTFIVGTAFDAQCNADYAWTDVGPGNRVGDLNGDGRVDALDRALVVAAIEENDGGPHDGDNLAGQVTLLDFGSNFSLYDIDNDGVIGPADLAFFPTPACAADFNGSGALTAQDIFDYLAAWFSGAANADFDGSGVLNVSDIFAFLNAWFTGC